MIPLQMPIPMAQPCLPTNFPQEAPGGLPIVPPPFFVVGCTAGRRVKALLGDQVLYLVPTVPKLKHSHSSVTKIVAWAL